MLNTRAKGARTLQKAKAWAEAQGWRFVPMYQVSRWAQAQPFDAVVTMNSHNVLVEVRSNRWQVDKPQTKALAAWPTEHKAIWCVRDGKTVPEVRTWQGTQWSPA